MACSVIHSWTFTTLFGAFIDLCLAYLLLCGSTIAFFAAKFLGFFGLNLPCSCNGIFGDPSSNCGERCIQRFLVDYPGAKISSVQMSVLSKFPYDSIWFNEDRVNVKLVTDSRSREALLEMAPIDRQRADEESCSSYSKADKCGDLTMSELSKSEHDGFGFKGKQVWNQRPPRYGMRRRRKGVVENGKCSSVSSSGHPQLTRKRSDGSLRSESENGQENSDECSVGRENFHGDHTRFSDNVASPRDIGVVAGTLLSNELNGSVSGGRVIEKDVEEPVSCIRRARSVDINVNERNAIRILEQALEEERAARTALYLDLEKERSAASSAADEAMAMMLRLQKEKAAIEMESRQYQRMIEERSAYDEEEMDLLKEILLRREREKLVLENEVHVYRQMLSGEGIKQSGEYLRDLMEDISGKMPFPLFETGDPSLILQKISESLREKEIGDANKLSGANTLSSSVEKQNDSCLLGIERVPPDHSQEGHCGNTLDVCRSYTSQRPATSSLEGKDENSKEFQEKGMVSIDEHKLASLAQLSQLKFLKKQSSHEKTFILVDKEHEQNVNGDFCHVTAEKNDGNFSEIEHRFSCANTDRESHDDVDHNVKNSIAQIEVESSVHDIHVVDDKVKLCNISSGKESETLVLESASCDSKNGCFPVETSGVTKTAAVDDGSSISRAESRPGINRSVSDIVSGSPSPDSLYGNASSFDFHINSVRVVDNERLKLESEVGWLTERLRRVQEGKGKLNFSLENKEREDFQLQLLGEIAHQLQEIRKLTEPRKAIRQSSLPPSSSKVNSKKRRCRSVSWGIHEST